MSASVPTRTTSPPTQAHPSPPRFVAAMLGFLAIAAIEPLTRRLGLIASPRKPPPSETPTAPLRPRKQKKRSRRVQPARARTSTPHASTAT